MERNLLGAGLEQTGQSTRSHAKAGAETTFTAHMQNLEATFEQLIQQTSASLRKDMAAREDRLARRMDTERKEQQTALFELRRDLTLQQTSDLAAHEDRLSRRLDGERREQKAGLAELRRDSGVQQEHRVQIANLRRDLGTTQGALSKLAQSRPVVEVGGNEDPAAKSTGALEQATAAVEAAVSDMRRELSGQREQVQLQAATAETSLGELRKELLMLQGEESRSVHEQLSRSTSELARNIQEVTSAVEASANGVRSELWRELEGVSAEIEAIRSHSEHQAGILGKVEAHGVSVTCRLDNFERNPMIPLGGAEAVVGETQKDIGVEVSREVARAEGRLADNVSAKIAAIETSLQGKVAFSQASLDEVHRSVGRFSQDLTRERNDRSVALTTLSNRIEDVAVVGEQARAEQRLFAKDGLLTSRAPSTSATVTDLGDSASRCGGGAALGERMGLSFGSSDHVALAACVGELDAELRLELSKRLDKVVVDIREEMANRVGAVEVALDDICSGGSGAQRIAKIDTRMSRLEGARLELRLGALESAAQHCSLFIPIPSALDSSLLAGNFPAPIAPTLTDSGNCVPPLSEVEPNRASVRQADIDKLRAEISDLDVSQRCFPPAEPNSGLLTRQDSCSTAFSRITTSRIGDGQQHQWKHQQSVEAAAASIDARLEAKLERIFDHNFVDHGAYPLPLPERKHALQACPQYLDDGCAMSQPISSELKDRLETLVHQVKVTLHNTHQQDPRDGQESVGSGVCHADRQAPLCSSILQYGGDTIPCNTPVATARQTMSHVSHMCAMSPSPVDHRVASYSPADHRVAVQSPGDHRVGLVTVGAAGLIGQPVLRSFSVSAPRQRSHSPVRRTIVTGIGRSP